MRSEPLHAMFHLVGLDKESFLNALHQLKSDFYSQKWRVRDGLDQFASAIVPCMVYCYLPGLPDEIPIVHLISTDGGPRWLIAYPKENIQHFDPVVHLQAFFEVARYAIMDLTEEQTGKNYQYELRHILPERTQYWPGKIVQLSAKTPRCDYDIPTRCSQGGTPHPGLEASPQRTAERDHEFSDRGLKDAPGLTDEKK